MGNSVVLVCVVEVVCCEGGAFNAARFQEVAGCCDVAREFRDLEFDKGCRVHLEVERRDQAPL